MVTRTSERKTVLILSICLIAVWLICFPTSARAGTITYQYDDAGRLTGVNYGDQKRILYTYDPMGNLLKRVSTTGATLADAIYVLQVLTGSAPATFDPMLKDANQDGKLGLAEAVFFLHQVSGME